MADGRRLRLPRTIWGLFALVSLVLGAVTAVLLGTSGQVSFTGAPQLQLPLPAPAGGSGSTPGQLATTAAIGTAAGAVALPALIEPGPFGPLPRIAADGRRPFLAYARKALVSGGALGVAQGYPVSLDQLRLWAATLAHKGLVLAPVSAFVLERSGLSAEYGDHGRLARHARG